MTKIVAAYSTDENFAALAVTSMVSALKNSAKSDEFVFLILHKDLSPETISRVEDIKKIKNCEIKFKRIENGEFKDFTHVHWITEASWYRCKIAELFPEYDRVLYIDCDTMVLGSLKELFETELKDNLVAGVLDICGINGERGHQKRIGLNNEIYLNSGVSLFNTKQWREENLFEKIKEYALKERPLMCDQDSINKLSDGRKVLVPQKYNFMEAWWDNNYHEYSGEFLKGYEEAKREPVIVHFTYTKPSSLNCGHSLKFKWWEYAKLTGFYEDLMRNLYKEKEKLVSCAFCAGKLKAKYNFLIFASIFTFGAARKKIKTERIAVRNKLRDIGLK